MKKLKKIDWIAIVAGILIVVVFVGSMVADGKANAIARKKVNSIAEISIPEVPNVTTDRKTGVITAEEWAAYYPDIYASHAKNAENTGTDGTRLLYPETNPDIVTLYDGMAFSKFYDEAIGHNYTLEDIANTGRPHKLANCLTCKTPDFTALVNELGTEVYSKPFDEIMAQVSEPVSCYNCHANTPGTIVITSDYMADAMGDEIEDYKVSAIDVSCAQCHIEYYFDPTTKATTTPYQTVDEMAPEKILAYYNEMGFSDYTNANTGVGQIKVQHPEFETFYGKDSAHKGTYTCADCHMGYTYNEKGDPYVNHEFTSPLDNEELIKNTCSQCHPNLAGMVQGIQEEITTKENKVSAILVEVNQKLAEKLAAGTIDEDTAAQVRQLDRDAQFYWDFVFVENSEGAHNSSLAANCLAKAEKLAKQALALL